ncbi:hypothetical protein D1007_57175 [Hordeum vulgare]|nr:hypothetical protein D1007_57175 [Hordeum vulgare]
MATFRLAGHTHCPDNIRRAAVLEIVEQTPARSGSDAPTITTLTYPISIAVARVAPSRTPQLAASRPQGMEEMAHARGMARTAPRAKGGRATAAASAAVRTCSLRAALTAWPWTHPCGELGTKPPVPMVLSSPTHGRRPPAWLPRRPYHKSDAVWPHGRVSTGPRELVALPEKEGVEESESRPQQWTKPPKLHKS